MLHRKLHQVFQEIFMILFLLLNIQSQEFINTSKIFRVEESSSTVACEDLIPGDSMKDEFSGYSTI